MLNLITQIISSVLPVGVFAVDEATQSTEAVDLDAISIKDSSGKKHYSNKYEEAMIELEKYLDKEVIDRIKNGTK